MSAVAIPGRRRGAFEVRPQTAVEQEAPALGLARRARLVDGRGLAEAEVNVPRQRVRGVILAIFRLVAAAAASAGTKGDRLLLLVGVQDNVRVAGVELAVLLLRPRRDDELLDALMR